MWAWRSAREPTSRSGCAARSSQRRCVASAPSPSCAGCRGPVVDHTVEALLAGGFRTIEFTFDSEDAAGAIARWRADGRAAVGAGTIRRADEVDAAVEAGAQFLVAPTYQEAVVERALELGVPCVPGALSPTEIDTAWQQGATFVKLFPAGAVGAGYLSAVLNPLKDVEILVTGRRRCGERAVVPRRGREGGRGLDRPARPALLGGRRLQRGRSRGARAARRRRLILARRRRATGRARAWRARP